MTYNRNQYLLHRNGPRNELTPQQLQAQADAVAAYHKRLARRAMIERLCAIGVFVCIIGAGLSIFIVATN